MKTKTFIIALGLAVVASTAFGASPANIQALRSDYETPAVVERQNQAIIATKAYKDAEFFAALKTAAWTFDGVRITEAQIVTAQVIQKDFEDIDASNAAKYLAVSYYKMYVAAKVAAMGNDTVAAYDWIQAQRLATVQAAVPTSADKDAFLADLGAQVLAAAKAKQ